MTLVQESDLPPDDLSDDSTATQDPPGNPDPVTKWLRAIGRGFRELITARGGEAELADRLTAIVTTLALKANSADLGTAAAATLDTDPTLAANSNTRVPSQQAIRTFVANEFADLIAGAPGALDTLNELAAAIGDDANFASTITALLATKLDASAASAFGLTLIDAADATTARGTLGLGNVENTADADKPISTATQTALDDLDDRLTDTETELDARVVLIDEDFAALDGDLIPVTAPIVSSVAQVTTPSLQSGPARIRFVAAAANTSVNRRDLWVPRQARPVCDAEVRSTVYARSSASMTGGRFQPGHAHRISRGRRVLDWGVTTASGTTTQLNDTGKAWATNQFAGGREFDVPCWVELTPSDLSAFLARQIRANASTSLTLYPALSASVATGVPYRIVGYAPSFVGVLKNVAFDLHGQWLIFAFVDGIAINLGSFDLQGYLGSGGSNAWPLHIKSRVVGNLVQFAVWLGSDPEPDYGASGQSGQATIPASLGLHGPGEHGLIVNHLAANDWLEFSALTAAELV